MYIKKSIASVVALAVLAGGYVAGAYIGLPGSGSDSLDGNIGKAKAYNDADNQEVLAAMEQLANDTAMQKKALAASLFIGARLNELDEVFDVVSQPGSDDWKKLVSDETVTDLATLKKRTDNARKAYEEYVAQLAEVINGAKVENFEQTSNNALLAYTVLDNSLNTIAPKVSSEVTKALTKNPNEKIGKVASGLVITIGRQAAVTDNPQLMSLVGELSGKLIGLLNNDKFFKDKPDNEIHELQALIVLCNSKTFQTQLNNIRTVELERIFKNGASEQFQKTLKISQKDIHDILNNHVGDVNKLIIGNGFLGSNIQSLF